MKDGLYWMRFIGGTSNHPPFVAMLMGNSCYKTGMSLPFKLLESDLGVTYEILGPVTPPGKLFLLQCGADGNRFGGVFSSMSIAENEGRRWNNPSVHEITVDEFIRAGGMETFAIYDEPVAREAMPPDTIEIPAGGAGGPSAYIQATSSEEALRKYKASQEQVVP